MSLETWKAEFYPVEPSPEMTDLEAVEHSLRKWEGLWKENLEKHGLIASSSTIREKENDCERFEIDGESCSLCVKYISRDFNRSCGKCPLKKVNDETPCDLWNDSEVSIYGEFGKNGNPEPMIKGLKKALKMVKAGGK